MAGAWGVDADDLADVATALRFEEDGARMRRALAKELREAVDPAVAEARAGIMAMGSAGLDHDGEGLRSAIARNVKAQTRMSGKAAGVRVRVPRTGMPRGFRDAPKRTNRAAGWRHPVFGRDAWVQQMGAPGWFDDPLQRRRAEYRAKVEKVIADTADRIRRAS